MGSVIERVVHSRQQFYHKFTQGVLHDGIQRLGTKNRHEQLVTGRGTTGDVGIFAGVGITGQYVDHAVRKTFCYQLVQGFATAIGQQLQGVAVALRYQMRYYFIGIGPGVTLLRCHLLTQLTQRSLAWSPHRTAQKETRQWSLLSSTPPPGKSQYSTDTQFCPCNPNGVLFHRWPIAMTMKKWQ